MSRDILANWGDDHLVPGPMNPEVGQELAERLIRIVQQTPDVKTVCDLGCGTGYLASRLGALGYQVCGVDGSQRLLGLARKHYASDRVTFAQGLFGDSSLDRLRPDGGFDLIISSDVVEHLFEPALLVDTAFRWLRPGGSLVLGTPYHGYLKNLAISVLGQWDQHHGVHWNGGHIKFFSVRTLHDLVRQAGFADAGFHYYGRVPYLWMNMICVARRPE